jgi:hypothetical protein
MIKDKIRKDKSDYNLQNIGLWIPTNDKNDGTSENRRRVTLIN